jgi:hypothetical protein
MRIPTVHEHCKSFTFNMVHLEENLLRYSKVVVCQSYAPHQSWFENRLFFFLLTTEFCL